jgi:hypothetical protein
LRLSRIVACVFACVFAACSRRKDCVR